MNTKVTYLYVDDESNRISESVVFAGIFTEEEKRRMSQSMVEGQWFIPEQVGLDRLAIDGDSIWHKWDWGSAHETSESPTFGTSCEDVSSLFASTVWNPMRASARINRQRMAA